MSTTPARNFTRVAIAIVLGALIISLGIFASSEGSRTVTKTTTEVGTTTTLTSTSTATLTSVGTVTTTTVTSDSQQSDRSAIYSNVTDGLQLTAMIDRSAVLQGQNLTVTAQVYNTLPIGLVMNATSMDNPAYGPCQQDFATGIDVYEGHYTSVNLSKATELLLYNPSLTYACPRPFTFQYSFPPNSDVATIHTYGGGAGNTTGPVNETSQASGYWTGSGQSYNFTAFPQGTYTVVAFDAWGQNAIGYFQVMPQNPPFQVEVPSYMFQGGYIDAFAFVSSLLPAPDSWSVSCIYPNGTAAHIDVASTEAQSFIWRFDFQIPNDAPLGNYSLIIQAQYQGISYAGTATFVVGEQTD
jgi:hypothetical protein